MDDSSRLMVFALARLAAAHTRQHGALARRLTTTSTDVLALHYVVTATDTAPGQLASALVLSPSGASAVINRLSRAGLITRARRAGRHRVALNATDAGRELHTRTLGPSSDDLERLVADLPRGDRMLLEQFLTRVADLAERQADQLIAKADADARAAAGIPPPVLWG